MKKYIALLRGINVSGKNIIKMAELKTMFDNLGIKNTQTYIQSGNIIFESDKSNLEKLIESEIINVFNLNVPTVLLEVGELENIVKCNPFEKRAENDKMYFTFLGDYPKIELIDKIDKNKFLPDEFEIIGKTIYIYCPNGYGNTKLTNTFFEKKLNQKATSRNLNTSLKLIELSK